MRIAHIMRGMLALAAFIPIGVPAAEVRSEAPAAVAVTVYRSLDAAGRFELDALSGFALITETRRVTLPAGESTLRFEGVAGGIEAESAIVTGFDEGVIEKNRDARLLSPAALIASSLGREVELKRTQLKTGSTERIRGTVVSDADGGVLFKSAAGVEALRCSGLPETFSFERFAGASATPTLSVRVRSASEVTRNVTLSYLASGFDWSATYTATLSGDGRTMNLGAWVTLANSNGETFRDAQTQVVAGRLNREARAEQPVEAGGPILAQCWPRGSTTDIAAIAATALREAAADFAPMMAMRSLAAPGALQDAIVMLPKKVEQEQLGDLKLYRVPDRTTVAARQMKQVRLMDQFAVPVKQVYSRDLYDRAIDEQSGFGEPVSFMHKLRTRNTAANHLGLPLPSGAIAVFASAGGARLLVSETEMQDHALDEPVEVDLGLSSDVRATVISGRRAIDAQGAAVFPLFPGVALRRVAGRHERRVEISNAGAEEADVEWKVRLDDDAQVIGADHPAKRQDGRSVFNLRVPAGGRAVLRYAIAKNTDLVLRAR